MADSWCSCGWEYRRKITIKPDDIAGDEVNFPFLVDITDNDLKDVANAGHMESANGYDMRFYIADCTELDFEIEYYDNTTGHIIAWVKVPALSSTGNTEIYIYYGNDDPAVLGADPSSTNTWDANFGAVWHMTDLTNATIKDSTANGNNGTKGAANNPPEGNGIIYKCQGLFTGDHINCGNDVSMTGTHMTIEAWVNWYNTTNNQVILHKMNVAETQGYKMQLYGANFYYAFYGVGTYNYPHGMSTSSWYHIVTRWDGTNSQSRINSVQKHTQADAGAINFGAGLNFDMGMHPISSLYFTSYLDEVRVSDDARSNNWLDTTYFNGLDPTSMITLGSEEESKYSPDCAGTALCATTYNCDGDCGYFRVKGDTYDLWWNSPEFRTGVNSSITKNLKRFNFWSGNYKIYTPDTAEQPTTLKGIEYYRCESTVTDPGYNAWDNFYCKFYYAQQMADNNENIIIYGLGDCVDAIYVIKTFRYRTVKGATACLYYEFVLEKVRDLLPEDIAAL